MPHQLRSSPLVDADACFLATSEYYLSTVGGFSVLIRDVRAVLRALVGRANAEVMHCGWPAHNASPAVCPGLLPEPPTSPSPFVQIVRPCSLLAPSRRFFMRVRPRVPSEGSCAHRQAECAAQRKTPNAGSSTSVGALYEATDLKT